MRNYIAIFVLMVIVVWAAIGYSQNISVGRDGSIRGIDVRAMVTDKAIAYLATRTEIFIACDNKEKWKSVFVIPPGDNEIQCISGKGKNIFAGTKKGLYRSQDYGRTWQNVFRTILPEKNNIQVIQLYGSDYKKIAIGTMKGIFLSDNSGDRWKDVSANLRNRRIRSIAVDAKGIYAGGDDGIYLNKAAGGAWERIYVIDNNIDGEEEDISDIVEIEENAEDAPSCSMAVLRDAVYCGIGKKIIYTQDLGKNWQGFTTAGLSGRINHIICAEKEGGIYCATTKGVFEFAKDKEMWCELYKGMEKRYSVRSLVMDGDAGRTIWALTKNGIYKIEKGAFSEGSILDVEKGVRTLHNVFDGEPSFGELRQAALKYAECEPEKIRSWRTQARLKALLPKVSLGADNRRSTNSQIYTSASKDYIVIGPDDISKGIDVSVSWELGDLIWSDDQVAIDVRSRLTTQLRNDILDDLRRSYYERKRLQLELVSSQPSDTRLVIERQMRLKELTQAIDDLTDNYLSDNMKSGQPFDNASS